MSYEHFFSFLQIANFFVVPLLLVGIIKKSKALVQNRFGTPVLQSFFDILKFLSKGETISQTASWIFLWTPRIALAIAVVASVATPWTGAFLPASWSGATNFFFVLYLLALSRFFCMLAAMDTGSAFGGLGASREATISMLVEPIMVVSFAALAIGPKSANLADIYGNAIHPFVAIPVVLALGMAILTELSRMPVDDPFTHLELTMIHEATILENSGRNLALSEFATALRTSIFLGLLAQTFLCVFPSFFTLPPLGRYALGVFALLATGFLLGVLEGVLVKLQWRSVPRFLAFAAIFALFAALVAIAID